MKKMSNMNFFPIFVILAFLICIGFLYKIQMNFYPTQRIMSIEGKAEREIDVDIAILSLYFEHSGEKQSDLNEKISAEKPKVLKFLAKNGISEKEIEIYDYFREDFSDGQIKEKGICYRMGYQISIKSGKIHEIKKIRDDLNQLHNEGIHIIKQQLETVYSKRDIVQDELTCESIKNAVERAHRIADSLKLKVKRIISIGVPHFVIGFPNTTLEGGNNWYDSEIAASKLLTKRAITAKTTIQVEIK